jgi:Porin subfamily
LGFVVGAGIKLNAPMIGQGDYLQAQVNYTQGALRYIFQTPNSNWGKVNGASEGFGVLSDAVYDGDLATANATDLELTTAWNINAAYDHFWSARWRTSLYGGYAAVSYNDRGNAMACAFATGSGAGTTAVANPGCDNNWSTWWLGSRTQWNVTKDFYMGLDVMYSKLSSASLPGNTTTFTTPSAARLTSPMWTTGSSASACIATSIPDRWLMGI